MRKKRIGSISNLLTASKAQLLNIPKVIINLPRTLRRVNWSYRLRIVLHTLELKLAQFSVLPLRLRASIGVLAILSGAAFMMPAQALTTDLAPVSNVGACGWALSCSYVNIKEGAVPNIADDIGTGTNGSGGEVAVFEMADPVNVKTATELKIAFHAYSASIGSTADTVDARLTVGGAPLTLTQGAMTTTPGWYYFTYSGSWTQTQLNDMQLTLTRNVVGSGGSPSSRDDDVRVTSIYVSMTYTENSSIEQAGYRFYENNTTPSPSTTFARAMGGTSDDYGYYTVPTSDGGFAATGYSLSFGSGEQLFLAKYDSSGTQTFYKTWGGTGDEGGFGLIQTSDGGYAVSGYTSSSGGGGYDLALVKFNSAGDFSFAKAWGGTGTESGYGIVQTSDGGYALTGYSDTTGYSAGATDMLLVKFSSTGSLDFARTWGGTAGDWGWGITQTSDGGYALASQTKSFGDTDGDILFAKFNSDGSFGYARTWGGTLGDNGYGVIQTSDGSYVINGYYTDTTTSSVDTVMIKLNSTGNFSLANGWNSGGTESIDSLIKTADGGFAAVGGGNGSGAGDYDSLLMKFDSSMNLTFARTLGGSAYDKGRSVAQTNDGGYAIVGETLSFGAGANEAFVAKYDSTGTITGCSAPTCQAATGTSKSAPGTFATSPAGTMRSPAGTFTNIASPASTSQTPAVTVIVSTPAPTVGSPLAAVNTAAIAPVSGTPFRLRVNLAVSNGLAADGSFKLQLAPRNADNICDNDETGYADITTSTAIKYYDNSTIADGATYSSSVDDPTRLGVGAVVQTYEEASPFLIKNSIPAGEDGLWDFALTLDSAAPSGVTYCIKVVSSTGTDINNYSQVATISTQPPAFEQSSYRFFENSSATAPITQALGGTGSDQARDVVRTTDGGYAVIGSTDSFGNGMFIAKYDKSGVLNWNKMVSGVTGVSIIVTSDGGYAVGGNTSSFGAGGSDMFMAKYDSSGNLNWSRTWGTSVSEDVGGIAQTTDGGYVLAGSVSTGGYDMATVKLSSTGTLEWARTWGSATGFDFALSVTATSDGGAAVTGQTALGSGAGDVFLVKYTSTGSLSWSRAWGGTSTENGYDVVQTSDGGYAVVGDSISYGTNSTADILLVKFNSTGTAQWARTWGGTNVESGYAITEAADGDLVIGGQTNSYGNGSYDLALVRYSSTGTLELSRTFGGTAADFSKGVAIGVAGGYAIVGYTASYGAGGDDALFARFNNDGTMTNCSSPMCQSVTPGVSSPVVTAATPSPVTASPTQASAGQSVTTSTPAATITSIVDGSDVLVGNPLSAQDTAASVAIETPFRLRSRIAVDDGGLQQNGQDLKLQYKEKSGDICDPNAAGYSDMSGAGSNSQLRIAGAGSSVALSGQDPWSSPGNVTQDDGINASISFNAGGSFSTEALQSASHGFSIPASATITGIELIVDRSSIDGGSEASVRLLKSGALAGEDKARTGASFNNAAGNWGGPTDLWGTTWSPAEINSVGFGASLEVSGDAFDPVDLYVDDMQIKVYYDDGAGPILGYYDDSSLNDASLVAASVNDPTNGSRPAVTQSYRETGPFTNDAAAIPAGSDGLWDFALTSSSAADGKTYCLRTVKSDNSLLDSYAWMPEITIGNPIVGPTLNQQVRGGQSVMNGVKTPLTF